jgi:hypothetical protein
MASLDCILQGAKKMEVEGCKIGTARRMMARKCKVQTSAGKAMASVFWDSEGILSVKFFTRNATINSQ